MSDLSLWFLAVMVVSLVQEDDGTWRLPYADEDIDGPGKFCPWPFEPATLWGQPIGQFHCGYCGSMVMAGMGHIDYKPGFYDDLESMPEPVEEGWP